MSDQAEHNVSRPNRDPERARRVLAQHAETARLLGVDFIPVRSGTGMSPVANSGNANPAGSKAAQQPANEAPQQTPRTETTPKADSASREPASPEQASPKQASHAPATPAANLSPEQSAAQARLDALRARYEADAPHQHFVTDFNNIVFGEGDPCARLMFIGEAPGADEDATGRPFVGRAGQLLEKMIVAMGLSRDTVYICNVLKTRPPNNQTPTTKEAALCAPYLVEQISIVDPEVIVVLGLTSAKLVLETSETMSRLRGNWHAFPPDGESVTGSMWAGHDAWEGREPVAVMPTYHPAFLLRSYTPENRRKVWSDLQMVLERLGMPLRS